MLIGFAGILALVLFLLFNKKTPPQNSEYSESISTPSDEKDVIDDSAMAGIESKADDMIQETEEDETEGTIQEVEEAEADDVIQEAVAEAEADDQVQETEEETGADDAMISNAASGEQADNTETKEYFIPETALYYNGHHYYLYNDVKSDVVASKTEEAGASTANASMAEVSAVAAQAVKRAAEVQQIVVLYTDNTFSIYNRQ